MPRTGRGHRWYRNGSEARTSGTPPLSFAIKALENAGEDVPNAIRQSLLAYNAQHTGVSDYRPLTLAIEDSTGHVIGGLHGRTSFGWLFIELLLVPEPLRGRGISGDLLLRAESDALARGCRSAWLDTFDFQARRFYERLGYAVFGQLKEYPAGHARFFMRKSLATGVGEA